MSWQPELTVAAIVMRDDRFLIVEERIRGQRVFNQPAGHVEAGETLIQAVVRETAEETAWQFTPTHLVGVYLWQRPKSTRTTIRFAFAGTVGHHAPGQALDAPIIAIHWLRGDELRQRTAQLRTPLVLRGIHDYLSGQRWPLEAIVDLRGL
jgi:phosphatase NudJ